MYYQQNIDHCFAEHIGATGLESSDFEAALQATESALAQLGKTYKDGALPLLRLPGATSDLEIIEPVAERHIESFDHVVVLGTGGSSLGGQTLAALTDQGHGDSPRVHFMDNIDPHTFETLFQLIDPVRTGFIVISKSGGTAETLTQFLYSLDVFRKALGDDAVNQHFTIITEPADNPLRRIGVKLGCQILDHDPGIGGRYSALSLVGLLPALIAGVDAQAVRTGARSVLAPILDGAEPAEVPAAVGAALNVALLRHCSMTSTVLMPYIDRFADFGLWFRQLWAESLGKNGTGTTPINAIGTVDQHSQLQLYLAGPRDKMFTLIFGQVAGTGGTVPADLAKDPALSYLAGRRMGDLMDAEQRATAETLAKTGCPTRIMTLEQVDEASLGALMMHYMLETIIAADLLGVDPFDQPAVKEGKVLAREFLAVGRDA